MVRIFANQYMGDGCLGRQAAHDQVERRWRLGHPVGAGPAGIFRADGDNDAQLGWHDIQPFRAVLADLVHDAAAAGTDQAVRFDDLFNTRQRSWQVADGALWRGFARPVVRLGGTGFLLRLDLCQGDGQVFESQLPLILGQLFRPLAMQRMVQLGDQMLLPTGEVVPREVV